MKNPNVRPKRVCSPRYALLKARKGVELNQWELEDLAKSHEYALDYAMLKGSFPEAEEMFLSHASKGNVHARRFFLDCEFKMDKKRVADAFLKSGLNTSTLVEFTKNAIKGRWPEAEKQILSNADAALEYQQDVMKCRWEKLEDKILFSRKKRWNDFAGRWTTRSEVFSKHVKFVGRHPDLEKKLEKVESAKLIRIYATDAVRGRLPPTLHQKLMLMSFVNNKKSASAKNYLRFIEMREKSVLKYLSSMTDDDRKQFLEKIA